ncbi:calcium/sodium antiporter [Oceanithermus sp.]|uniref:calcium/sodium antiporter n=1 Tax=Oceanithermus sp. TaxID=2268145 RepID=UPI0025D3D6F3|nr:calcium/sodium antiporter [Oceanithermus sp.]
MAWFWVGLGIGLLYLGGEGLVRYSVALARRLGISPLVVGLTVVAFGTSAPELAATLAAAFKGSPQMAYGNVVGSNIANLSLVLGLAALVRPLRTQARFIRREMPFLFAVSLVLFAVLADGAIGRLEGALLVLGLVVYLGYLLREREEPPDVEAEFAAEFRAEGPPPLLSLLGVAGGVVLLTLGATSLVEGAVALARSWGVPDRVIGLTVVALGTSLPELASALVAARKGESEIVLGNLVGSNIFNVFAILGITALVHPIRVNGGAPWLDLGVMLALVLLAWPFLYTGLRLGRREGAVLLAVYLLYVRYLFVA